MGERAEDWWYTVSLLSLGFVHHRIETRLNSLLLIMWFNCKACSRESSLKKKTKNGYLKPQDDSYLKQLQCVHAVAYFSLFLYKPHLLHVMHQSKRENSYISLTASVSISSAFSLCICLSVCLLSPSLSLSSSMGIV